MKTHAGELPLARLCRLFELPRSTVYYRAVPRATPELEPLKAMVQALRASFPRAGVRKMYHYLVRDFTRHSRAQVRQACLELGFLGRPRPRKPRTTDSRGTENRFPNRIKGLAIERVHQVWVADVTFIRLPGRFAYLALLMDARSRTIVGWSLSFHNDRKLVHEALAMALLSGSPEIHHSDQGTPYGSRSYVQALRNVGALSSMSAAGKPEENGRAERLNRTVKEEEVQVCEYQNLPQAKDSIAEYIRRYNSLRLHQALGYRTPQEVFEQRT